MKTAAGMARALTRLGWPVPQTVEDDPEQPIFLLASSNRSGSTLLQRILVTDPRVLLWGEPLGRMGLIGRLADGIYAAEDESWKFENDWLEDTNDLSQRFIANTYPPGTAVRDGLRSFIMHWFKTPAQEKNFERWGLKEVRLDAADACLLHWLFPRGHIVMLVRNPIDSWTSAMNAPTLSNGGTLWLSWPTEPIQHARHFATYWNKTMMSWVDATKHVPATVIKYEDVVSPKGPEILGQLGERLRLKLDVASALGKRIGGTSERGKKPTPEDIETIRQVAGEGMKAFGYL